MTTRLRTGFIIQTVILAVVILAAAVFNPPLNLDRFVETLIYFYYPISKAFDLLGAFESISGLPILLIGVPVIGATLYSFVCGYLVHFFMSRKQPDYRTTS